MFLLGFGNVSHFVRPRRPSGGPTRGLSGGPRGELARRATRVTACCIALRATDAGPLFTALAPIDNINLAMCHMESEWFNKVEGQSVSISRWCFNSERDTWYVYIYILCVMFSFNLFLFGAEWFHNQVSITACP